MDKIERISQRIEETKAKLEELKTRQKQMLKRKRALEKEKARKLDTRRKILIGAAVMKELQKNQILQILDRQLKRDDERELFGLPPLPPSHQT